MEHNQNLYIYVFLGAFVATVVATLIYVKFSGLRDRIEKQYENSGKFERDSWILDIICVAVLPIGIVFFSNYPLSSAAWGMGFLIMCILNLSSTISNTIISIIRNSIYCQ